MTHFGTNTHSLIRRVETSGSLSCLECKSIKISVSVNSAGRIKQGCQF